MQLLLDRGAEIEPRDNADCAPLSHAADCGAVDVVQLLPDRGVGAETRDSDAWTPLSDAAWDRREDTTQSLLDRCGAGIETLDGLGWSPPSHALLGGSRNFVRLLLDSERETETRDDSCHGRPLTIPLGFVKDSERENCRNALAAWV